MKPKYRLYIRIPKRIAQRNNPFDEALYYANLYLSTGSNIGRQKILESLMVNGSLWDIITRSVNYYPEFENRIGKEFPILWGQGNSFEAGKVSYPEV